MASPQLNGPISPTVRRESGKPRTDRATVLLHPRKRKNPLSCGFTIGVIADPHGGLRDGR